VAIITPKNVSAIASDHQNKDKYPKIRSNYSFKNVQIQNVKKANCQICCLLISDQKIPQKYSRATNRSLLATKSISQVYEFKYTTAQKKINNYDEECLFKSSINPTKFRTFQFSNKLVRKSKNNVKSARLFEFSKLLTSGDIEPNPGPGDPVLSIKTYNVRGLKNRLKLKRVLNSCHKSMSENTYSIFFLQEAHLEESDNTTLEMMWRHKFILSPGTNRQCGCLTLFDSSWSVAKKELDSEGRFSIIVLERSETSFIMVNVYAPNDHNLNFFANLFNKIIETQISFPMANTIMAGDFNLVLTESDSVNRTMSNIEQQCQTLVNRNLNRLNLVDSYRKLNPKGGFTWARGSCMSRLDMIFVSKETQTKIISSKVDWSFDNSDHALLETNIAIQLNFKRGPGLIKVNADILDDNNVLEQVKTELKILIEQIPSTWNPHMKMDFIKASIRSIISIASGKIKRIENIEQDALKEQINYLMLTKEKIEQGIINKPNLLNNVDASLAILNVEHDRYLDQVAKRLSIRAQAKWYEEGEKSNKYFLNIIKKRSEQKSITKLRSNTDIYVTQDSIMNHVTEFYSSLYDHRETNDNYDYLFADLPKLQSKDNETLDQPITTEELKQVVDGCNESAPGPDGLPYKIYKKLWDLVGDFLLDSWKYSLSIGTLPLNQRMSTITLLPKPGKDLDKIENWRPITLSNCDLKIFTKLLSNRVLKVLENIIHPCQTAYVPGRIVHDNLRMFDFYNNYCKTNNVDALLISLDAKKAFDSVSHKYLYKVLSAYGFSQSFIDTVEILYKDLRANILVNGYRSTIIKILRSVKQGDALSCALFILCIDPLIRKIENNPEIKPVNIPRSQITDINIQNKVGGFADDIGMVINNDQNSIDNVFKDYKLFTNLSGIELNVDKTEILKMNVNTLHSEFQPHEITIGKIKVKTVESITICGICFSNNSNIAYEKNLLDKITKMERQLIIWLQRPISVEGKILIVKTFGLSQLIFALQMCDIEDQHLTDIERMIFKFLWNKKWVGTSAPDRIKRSTLKLPYERGGLQVPDVTNLNKALKVKQFLRSMKTSHPINLIQKYQLERIGYDEYFKIEYGKLCKYDIIVRTFQQVTNQLTDYFRLHSTGLPLPDPEDIRETISLVASTDVLEYLLRKKELLIINRFGALAIRGVISFRQLYNESVYPRSDDFKKLATYIVSFFPPSWKAAMELAIDIDAQITYESEFPTQNLQLASHEQITVKSLRKTLLEMESTPPYPFNDHNKFELDTMNCTLNPFINIRKYIHAPRDKFFKYRILQGDIFCKARMFRFKMVESPMCDFCQGQDIIESIKHMLWDCPRAQVPWNYLQNLISRSFGINYLSYENIVLGSEETIPILECIIVLILKLIVVKDRTDIITNERIMNKIESQFTIEKQAMKNKVNKFIKRWAKLEPILFRDNN
jgi:exonuclease III